MQPERILLCPYLIFCWHYKESSSQRERKVVTWNAQQNNNEWKWPKQLDRKCFAFFFSQLLSIWSEHKASHYGVNSCDGCNFRQKVIVRNCRACNLDSLTFHPRAFYLPLSYTEKRGRTWTHTIRTWRAQLSRPIFDRPLQLSWLLWRQSPVCKISRCLQE